MCEIVFSQALLVPKANFHGDPHDKSCSYFLLNKPGPSRYDQTTKSEDLKDEVREKLIANELLNITIKSSQLVSSSFYIGIYVLRKYVLIPICTNMPQKKF